MSELKQFNSNLKKTINLDEMKEESKEVVKKVKEDYVEEKGKQDDFEIYMKSSNRLSEMQQHLISNIGLSMGIVSTIIFISNTKTFISSHLKYIIMSLMVYSFMLFITGYGEYIEKFVQFQKHGKFKDVTTWDYALSVIYFIVGISMLIVMIFLYMSLMKDKLV